MLSTVIVTAAALAALKTRINRDTGIPKVDVEAGVEQANAEVVEMVDRGSKQLVSGYPMPDGTTATVIYPLCNRCGGSGRYSWCEMYQDVCFDCAGNGLAAGSLLPEQYVATMGAKYAAQIMRNRRANAKALREEKIRTERLDNPDPRIAAFAAKSGIPLTWPEFSDTETNEKIHEFGYSLLHQYYVRGDLSDKQWAWVIKLTEEWDARQEEKDARETAKHDALGTAGAKLTADLTVLSVKGETNAYGSYQHRVSLEDEAGRRVYWTSSSQAASQLYEGDKVRLTGTVKKHHKSTYRTSTILGGRVKCELLEGSDTAPAESGEGWTVGRDVRGYKARNGKWYLRYSEGDLVGPFDTEDAAENEAYGYDRN